MRREACPPARPPATRPPRDPPHQTSGRREACPPARRPRRELRSAHPARPPRNAPRQTSMRRKHTSCFLWLLYAPVGGGPPARSPHASLRLGMIDLEARPGPATAHRHRSLHPNELRSARRLEARPGPAGLAPPPVGPPPTGAAAATPRASRPLFLWLPRLLLQHMTTAGNTPDETGDYSGSQRDKTLPARPISRSNGTKLSPLVIKRSFWPVLRMQGEFYPGYDIRGPQQGEFYPGILVAHGLHPGSAMIIHMLLARQRPCRAYADRLFPRG